MRRVSILQTQKIIIIIFVTFIVTLTYFNGISLNRTIHVQIQDCKCKREFQESYFNFWNEDQHEILYPETTCSDAAWRRGRGQKVMAYSYFVNSRSDDEKTHGYIKGIEANIKSIKKYFPGWIMRLYYDVDTKSPFYKDICSLACENSHFDICNIRNLPGVPLKNATIMFGMLWRFLATLDPQVDLMGSRDLDSLFSEREVKAVNEWKNSNKILHVMRDHPLHGTEILGGLWNTNLSSLKARLLWKKSWKSIFLDSRWTGSRRDLDQKLLSSHVWNIWGRENVLQHDSYLCLQYGNSIPWPVQRRKGPNNFVGAIVKSNVSLSKECPKECRKKSNWKYC